MNQNRILAHTNERTQNFTNVHICLYVHMRYTWLALCGQLQPQNTGLNEVEDIYFRATGCF